MDRAERASVLEGRTAAANPLFGPIASVLAPWLRLSQPGGHDSKSADLRSLRMDLAYSLAFFVSAWKARLKRILMILRWCTRCSNEGSSWPPVRQ